jgi:carboxypeptidase Taq
MLPMPMPNTQSCYDLLCEKSREIALIHSAAGVLGWDMETYMPKGGIQTRSQQLAWLSGKAHELSTCEAFQKALEKAESEAENLAPDEISTHRAANLREFRHEFDRATKLPQSLVQKESEATSLAKVAWTEARETDDFELFAPHLNTLLDIALEKTELWGYDDEPYDALFSGYERHAKTSDVAAMFNAIGGELADIARQAVEKSASINPEILLGDYPIEQQQILNREIAESIGFDFDRGRIDTTTHPFCTGLGLGDTRLTTRYLKNDFTSSLFGVLHESGHGMYDQGLPADQHGLPAGNSCSLGIHESQSRLWENHVGRSRPFWEKWLPRAHELFPNLRKIDLDTFLTTINRAEKNFIRVESDEATYDLHILLRFTIERQMINGELSVKDVPDAWNALFQQFFGITPPDNTHGCLQDIHWAMGGIGYFATYTLGNITSAQLQHTAMQDASIATAFSRADYAPLLDWLRQNIHQHGNTYFPQDLILRATGETTNPQYYLDHLRRRFQV